MTPTSPLLLTLTPEAGLYLEFLCRSWESYNHEVILLNPAASSLGREHLLLRGLAREYAAYSVEAPLSIKTVRSGQALWRSGGRTWLLHPGRFLILNDGEPYDIEVDSAETVETLCLFFRRGFVEDVIRNRDVADRTLLDEPADECVSVAMRQTIRPLDRLAPVLDRLANRTLDGTDATEDLVAVALEIAVVDGSTRREATRAPGSKPATRGEVLRRVLVGRDFIESHYDRNLRLSDIAAAAAMSSFHFHRSFRSIVGLTPLEYLTRVRLEHARRLLRATGLSVLQICHASGFESQPSFTRLFSSRYRTTPGQYRSQLRKIG